MRAGGLRRPGGDRAAASGAAGAAYSGLSLWHATLPEPIRARPPLDGDRVVDVAIVGAGFTGLWTAYYLQRRDPGLRIAVVEREVAGFGASGRNGGWCSALMPASLESLARVGGRAAALAQQRAMFATVDEVGRVCAEEGIDADYAKGGTITLARTPAQRERLLGDVVSARRWGLGEEDVRWLPAAEAGDRLAARDTLGARYTPHCAAVHPGRLVRGLADVVERRGTRIFERTPATALTPGQVTTPYGRLRAPFVVRATEGYTPELPGHRRVIVPVYSLMVATEPLPREFWDAVGWRDRETVNDARHLIVYGQRTADDRIAFGGRGAPYHFGSRVRPSFDREPRVFAALERTLRDMIPALGDAAFPYRWGGALGVPRDWFASVGLDRASGLAWAGGYVGDGVGAANLAGRTLADLLLDRPSELVGLPWVDHRSRRWEPEPLRWLGVNASRRVMTSADRVEARTGRPSRRAQAMDRLLGG